MGRRIIVFALLFSFVYTPLVFFVVDGLMKLPSISLTYNPGPLQYLRAAVIFVALIAPVGIFLYLDNRTPPWKKALLADGQGAWGVVRQIEGTGFAKNNMPYLRLILEVQPRGQAPFEAKFELPEFRVARLSQGDKVYVKYDPENKNHIVIADAPGGAAPTRHSKHQPPATPPDLAGQLERLAKMRQAGQLTPEEYEAGKRKLLG